MLRDYYDSPKCLSTQTLILKRKLLTGEIAVVDDDVESIPMASLPFHG